MKNGENSGSFEDKVETVLTVNICNSEYKILRSYSLIPSTGRTPPRIINSKGQNNLEAYFNDLLNHSRGLRQANSSSIAYSYAALPEKSNMFIKPLNTSLYFFPSQLYKEEKSECKDNLVNLENKKKATDKFKQKVLYDLLNSSSNISRKHLFNIEKLVNVFIENEVIFIVPKRPQLYLPIKRLTRSRETQDKKLQLNILSIQTPFVKVTTPRNKKKVENSQEPKLRQSKIEPLLTSLCGKALLHQNSTNSDNYNFSQSKKVTMTLKKSKEKELEGNIVNSIRKRLYKSMSPMKKISVKKQERYESIILISKPPISGIKPLNKKVLVRAQSTIIKSKEPSLEQLILSSLFICMRTYKSQKAKTKIKIVHEDYKHLVNHPINDAIYYTNQLINSISRSKEFNKKLIIALFKKLSIPLPARKNEIEPQLFKNKEIIHGIKEKLLKYLYSVVNKENEYENTVKIDTPKFSVSAVNNGFMIKSILRKRWWWTCVGRADEDLNFYWTDICCNSFIQSLPSNTQPNTKMTNHLECYYNLSDKKKLFIMMKMYYEALNQNPFNTLPLTFHIKKGIEDEEFLKFVKCYNDKKESIWIIKPGENTNRGNGIQLSKSLEEIKKIVESANNTGRTYIIQKYIENPLLVNKRKFDIRVFGLITSINGYIKGYFYEVGYIRTSSKEFTLKNLNNKFIHLTNDAIQQQMEDYGKYEPGNKLSFSEFQTFLDLYYSPLHIDFYRDLLSQIKVRNDVMK